MSNDDTSTEVGYLAQLSSVDSLRNLSGAQQLIQEAVENGLAASDPQFIGDRGMAFLVPDGYEVKTLDLAQWEDEPRQRSYIERQAQFIGVASLANYVGRHVDEHATVAYVTDVYGKGAAMLTSDHQVAQVVINDNAGDHPGRRSHVAALVLRPTAAARRWGTVLVGRAISQEQFLDLVVDGIGEIAAPDGAQLRDLIGDLHAIRSTEVQSVIRTGGEGTIQLKENVKLTAGTGDKITFPETMRIVFQPYAGVPDTVDLTLRIKPKVAEAHVVFELSCNTIDDELARVLGGIAADITERTGLTVHWVP